MKKMNWMKPVLALALGSLLFTACKDDDDNDFRFDHAGGYVIQNNDGGTATFAPYILFGVKNGGLHNGSVNYGQVVLPGTIVAPNEYETTPQYTASLDGINGIYNLNAVNEDERAISMNLNFRINPNELLGEMVVNEFNYQNGEIVLEMQNVGNADIYGLFINPVVEGNATTSRYYSWTEEYLPEPGVTEQSLRIPLPSSNLKYEALRISPMVISLDSDVPLILQGQERILKKGATAFEPLPAQ